MFSTLPVSVLSSLIATAAKNALDLGLEFEFEFELRFGFC